jgi:CBS domain-containing protein
VVQLIGENPEIIIIVTEKDFITGIYSDRDVLNTDFPWVNITDQALSRIDSVGSSITEFNSITSESGIGAALELMIALKKDHIGVIESGTKILKSVLNFHDIINFLHHNIRKLNNEVGYLLNQSVDIIFAAELLYIKSPAFVSGLRKELYLEDVNIAVLINEQSYPIKIITTRDLVCYLVHNSNFFDLNDGGRQE